MNLTLSYIVEYIKPITAKYLLTYIKTNNCIQSSNKFINFILENHKKISQYYVHCVPTLHLNIIIIIIIKPYTLVFEGFVYSMLQDMKFYGRKISLCIRIWIWNCFPVINICRYIYANIRPCNMKFYASEHRCINSRGLGHIQYYPVLCILIPVLNFWMVDQFCNLSYIQTFNITINH